MPKPPTLFELFKANLDTRPDEAAFLITSGDRSIPIPWRQFAYDIERVACGVRNYAPGAVVGVLGENSYEWMVGHAGVMFAGGVVVPLDPNLSADEIAERLAFVGAKALIHSALYSYKAREVAERMPDLAVAGFGSRAADIFLAKADRAFESGEKGIFSLPPPDETKVSTIVFTSGTTSKPRGVELTMESIGAFCEFSASQLQVRPGMRSLLALPLHHIFGVCTAYMMLGRGTSVGVCPDFRRLYDAVERFRAQYLFLVPALADILGAKIAQRGESAEKALGYPLEWILVGGAPLSMRSYEQLQSLGIQMLTGYGLTETAALYSIAPLGRHRPGSAGQAAGSGVGVETKVTPRGTLAVRGVNVFKGYYQDPERTAEVMDDGWFDTGDVGRIDPDGYVWITGRASRTIVLSSGKKVAPEELEEKLLQIPGFREALVSGDGETREIKAEIFAVVSEDTVRRQVELLNRSLPVYMRIRKVEVRSEPFERTSSGKIKLPGRPAQADSGAPRRPRRLSGLRIGPRFRKRRILLSLALVAVGVLLYNVLPPILANLGVTPPDAVAKVIKVIGECGEVALAVLAIVAYAISFTLFPPASGKSGGET